MAEIERDGVRLFYERTGEGPPLLLISPLGWSGAHWALAQRVDFAKDYEVITFDHRGTGRSSAPAGPYSTRLLARDVIALLEVLELDEPVFALGLDGGGAVLQWVCLDAPEALRAAVLVASGPGRIDTRPVPRSLPAEAIADLVEKGWPAYLRDHLGGPEYFVNRESPAVQPFLATFDGEGACALLPWLWHQQAGFEHETTERLAEIELPCFVLVGEQDDHPRSGAPSRIETSLELAKRLFFAEYVEIADAALALHIEQAAAFNEAVRDFLARR